MIPTNKKKCRNLFFFNNLEYIFAEKIRVVVVVVEYQEMPNDNDDVKKKDNIIK